MKIQPKLLDYSRSLSRRPVFQRSKCQSHFRILRAREWSDVGAQFQKVSDMGPPLFFRRWSGECSQTSKSHDAGLEEQRRTLQRGDLGKERIYRCFSENCFSRARKVCGVICLQMQGCWDSRVFHSIRRSRSYQGSYGHLPVQWTWITSFSCALDRTYNCIFPNVARQWTLSSSFDIFIFHPTSFTFSETKNWAFRNESRNRLGA